MVTAFIKIDGMTVTSSSHAVINAVANKMIKYSTNSSGEIVEIKTLDNDDTVIGGISEERINAEYDAENSRFYGQFFMDADSYVFFIDPYDAEESYLGGFYKTYLTPFDLRNGIWSLRVPGRTVGEVDVEANGFITRVILGDDSGYYKDIKQLRLDEFIGVKLKYTPPEKTH